MKIELDITEVCFAHGAIREAMGRYTEAIEALEKKDADPAMHRFALQCLTTAEEKFREKIEERKEKKS